MWKKTTTTNNPAHQTTLQSFYMYVHLWKVGLPRWLSSKESACTQKTWVWSLGWEEPLEKGMATHCSILAWKIPWTEKPGGLHSVGLQRAGQDWAFIYLEVLGLSHWITREVPQYSTLNCCFAIPISNACFETSEASGKPRSSDRQKVFSHPWKPWQLNPTLLPSVNLCYFTL